MDATAVLAELSWYTMTTAFLALALDAPADRLSSLDVWNDLQFAINPDGSPTDKVNPPGMGNFAAQFAGGLDIRLATPVTAIDVTALDQITVTTDQGPLTARAVIVSAPVTVLAAGKITFTLELPTAYQQAFADLPFGLVDKLGIAFSTDSFRETPANTVITRHLDAGLDAFATALIRLAGQPMMNLFFADDLARELEAGGAAAQEAFAREFLTDTYGTDAAKAPERTIMHPWGIDPWTMGSYSAAKVGKVGARATLAQPIDDRLFSLVRQSRRPHTARCTGRTSPGRAPPSRSLSGWPHRLLAEARGFGCPLPAGDLLNWCAIENRRRSHRGVSTRGRAGHQEHEREHEEQDCEAGRKGQAACERSFSGAASYDRLFGLDDVRMAENIAEYRP